MTGPVFGLVVNHKSICSDISSASSTSIPRCLTVLSSLLWPSRSIGSQLGIQSAVEHREIANFLSDTQLLSNCPNVFGLSGALGQ